MKHTPGEWKITPDFDYIRAPVDAFGYTGGQVICCMYNPLDFAGCDPRVLELKSANARLIAAAPDLLNALELVKAWDIENLALDIPQEIRAKMQAAMMKARVE